MAILSPVQKSTKNDLPDAKKEVTIGKGSLMHVEVHDVLDNKQMNRLIRRIARLDKKNFDVDLIYKKSRLKTRNYIRPRLIIDLRQNTSNYQTKKTLQKLKSPLWCGYRDSTPNTAVCSCKSHLDYCFL